MVCIALVLSILSAEGQVSVKTLGGGRTAARGQDAGFVDGNTLQSSQVNSPSGIAVDSFGNLYIADRSNGALRKLDVIGNRSSTLLTGLNQPVAVAVDATNNLYVLTRGDGAVRRIDSFGALANIATGLAQPTALAIHRGALYVTEAGGRIQRIDLNSRTATQVADGLNQPGGIAVLESGFLAVSETGAHRIRFVNPDDGRTELLVGTGVAGFRNGAGAIAQFRQPHHIARAPNGTLVVADRGNHRVRLITPDGNVTTLYGIDPAAWEGPECLDCTPIILPGWFDGPAEFAEAREPVGVAISNDGKVYTTELFYHLIREVTGAALTSGAGSGGGGPAVNVQRPIITPNSGYFPLGQDIAVVNPNTNAFFSNALYYTTDGTDPTTNSTRLELAGSIGTIRWRETTRDLTSLKLIAVVGGTSSEIVSGQPAASNEIGITRNLAAGPGSTIIIPVTVNLRPEDQLKSLQFRVEVAPASASAPAISDQFRPLSISTNDFIRVVTSSEPDKTSTFGAASYTNGAARGIAITFIGTQANLSVENFATVALVAVPIPAGAPLGSRYSINVLSASGTSDGEEAALPLATMPPREIAIAETGYIVGDSSPASWYNADRVVGTGSATEYGQYGFGDRRLNNNDVNNAFVASLGLRVPHLFSDLFDAMDAFPEDGMSGVGGDGLIRFLDWQVILGRSLGLVPDPWERRWVAGGVRVASKIVSGSPNAAAEILSASTSGETWQPQATVFAGTIEHAQPGALIDIPVWVATLPECGLAGLAFRATLIPEGAAPAINEPVQFLAAPGLAVPVQQRVGNHDLLCGWPLVPSASFSPLLQGQKRLGSIQARVPFNAQPGQVYRVRFSHADGSPDVRTPYDLETRPGSVWVQSAAAPPQEFVSAEWALHFFGNVSSDIAQPAADPDGDGLANSAEYLAGTNPLDARSGLRFDTLAMRPASGDVVLRWQTARGRIYAIETNPGVLPSNWTVVADNLSGTGAVQEWIHRHAGSARFYRIRVRPQFPQTQ